MIKAQPIVQIDTNETLEHHIPWVIRAYPTVEKHLKVGDYGILGFSDWAHPYFIVERKSLSDLIGSLTQRRDQFFVEIEAMRRFNFAAIIVEGLWEQVEAGDYRSRAEPNSMLATIAAIEVRANVHFVWGGTVDGAVARFEAFVRQFVRGIEKDIRRLEAGPPG